MPNRRNKPPAMEMIDPGESNPMWNWVITLGAIVVPIIAPFAAVFASIEFVRTKGRVHRSVVAMMLGSIIGLSWFIIVADRWAGHRHAMISQSNVTGIAHAISKYATDHNGTLPPDLLVLVRTGGIDAGMLASPWGNQESADAPKLEERLSRLARPGHVSYLYFGDGTSVNALSNNNLILFDLNANQFGKHDAILGDFSVTTLDRSTIAWMAQRQ
jgi:hypothetical protein